MKNPITAALLLCALPSGCFDRQVVVDRPDLRGREEILKVHVRSVKLEDGASPAGLRPVATMPWGSSR